VARIRRFFHAFMGEACMEWRYWAIGKSRSPSAMIALLICYVRLLAARLVFAMLACAGL
jgi:hypothetical protein